jgi:hypothetical protein
MSARFSISITVKPYFDLARFVWSYSIDLFSVSITKWDKLKEIAELFFP